MNFTEENSIDLRILFLKELKEIFGGFDKSVAEKIADRLRNAEADKIALRDPQAAETYRRQKSEF